MNNFLFINNFFFIFFYFFYLTFSIENPCELLEPKNNKIDINKINSEEKIICFQKNNSDIFFDIKIKYSEPISGFVAQVFSENVQINQSIFEFYKTLSYKYADCFNESDFKNPLTNNGDMNTRELLFSWKAPNSLKGKNLSFLLIYEAFENININNNNNNNNINNNNNKNDNKNIKINLFKMSECEDLNLITFLSMGKIINIPANLKENGSSQNSTSTSTPSKPSINQTVHSNSGKTFTTKPQGGNGSTKTNHMTQNNEITSSGVTQNNKVTNEMTHSNGVTKPNTETKDTRTSPVTNKNPITGSTSPIKTTPKSSASIPCSGLFFAFFLFFLCLKICDFEI